MSHFLILLEKAKKVFRSIASIAFEPALLTIFIDLGTNNDSLGPFAVSVYTVGYCFGPLLIAPASELYGRVAVLYPGFVLYLVALAVCGSSTNIAVFIVFQAVMGFAGITFLICGRAVVADIIPKRSRGAAVSFMTSGPTLVREQDRLADMRGAQTNIRR